MIMQNGLWLAVTGYTPDQLASAKKILDLFSGRLGNDFDQLPHRSPMVIVPADLRMKKGKQGSLLPQDYHMKWAQWIKGMVLAPRGNQFGHFAICVQRMERRELRIYSELRRVSEGSFALQLTEEAQQIMLLADGQMLLLDQGTFGGTEDEALPLPKQIHLY